MSPTITGADIRIAASTNPFFMDPAAGTGGFFAPQGPFPFATTDQLFTPSGLFTNSDNPNGAWISRFYPLREANIKTANVFVTNADNTAKYEIGIYDQTGTRVATTGELTGPAATGLTQSPLTATLHSGEAYYAAIAIKAILSTDLAFLGALYASANYANFFGSAFPKVIFDQKVALNTILSIVVDATGGTFTLTFNGQTTASIAYNASAATIKTRLENLSNIDVGDVYVSGDNVGDVVYVAFGGQYTGVVETLTSTDASLTGNSHTTTIGAVQEADPNSLCYPLPASWIVGQTSDANNYDGPDGKAPIIFFGE